MLTADEFSHFFFKCLFIFIALQSDLKFTIVCESAAIDFTGRWIKSVSTLELWVPWLLARKPETEPDLPDKEFKSNIKRKHCWVFFHFGLPFKKEVASHFSISAIKGKIDSYRLQFILSMLCAQQTLESVSFSLLSFCSKDQVVEWIPIVWYR